MAQRTLVIDVCLHDPRGVVIIRRQLSKHTHMTNADRVSYPVMFNAECVRLAEHHMRPRYGNTVTVQAADITG